MFTTLLNFCSNDLSAFYFDIRKDVIYCDSKSSINRRSSRTLLNIIFDHLVRWFAPSLTFTTEEAWKAMGNKTSIHLEDFIDCNTSYENDEINTKWILVKNIRKVATGAIEKLREEKIIRSSLEAHLDLYLGKDILSKVNDVKFSEVTITSSYNLYPLEENSVGYEIEDLPDIKVVASKVKGMKCQRCWKYEHKLIHDEICIRCDDAVKLVSE